MKKTYLQPSTVIVVLKVETVMAPGASMGTNGISFDSNGNGSIETQSDNAVSAGMSRHSSLWDDED